MLQINKIYHGDSFELINDIPDKSIDMILEDMPYGTTACKFDKSKTSQKQIDFLNWLKTLSYQQAPQYLELITEMIKKMFKLPVDLTEYWKSRKRIIKDNGAIVLTASQPFTSALVMSNIENFNYEWIWDKKMCSGFMAAKCRPLLAHENILVFAKNKTVYNPLFTERTETELKRFSHKFKKIESKTEHASHLTLSNMSRDDAKFKNPSTLIRINGLVNSSREKKQALHPTQKPVALFEYLILTYTNEGDLVVDGFAGSGTTGVAAIKTNRNFICIEKDLDIFQKAEKRIKIEQSKLSFQF